MFKNMMAKKGVEEVGLRVEGGKENFLGGWQ